MSHYDSLGTNQDHDRNLGNLHWFGYAWHYTTCIGSSGLVTKVVPWAMSLKLKILEAKKIWGVTNLVY